MDLEKGCRMTSPSRQRLLDTLAHRQPDRVPIDFGGTSVTGMHVSCVAALRDHYGLERRPVKVHEPYQMLGFIDEDLRLAMGVDVTGVFPRTTIFGFPNAGWREWDFRGQAVLVPENFRTTVEANGDVLIYPEGDLDVAPSGRMPSGSVFFDAIVRQPPIDDETLDVEDNLEEFTPIKDADLAHLEASATEVQARGCGIVATFGGTAFGDIALVPAPFLKAPKGIRDIAEWYMSTAIRRDYVHRIFEYQCEVGVQNLARIHDAIGDSVDAVYICGTDFGTQTSQFCSLRTFQELWLPYYRAVNDWVHANTAWKCFKHSCGSVEVFIESFIEAGFDILNPVQCSAAGMDPATLKARYGDRLVFWGGGVDTQHTLPFGTPEEVRVEVLQRCEIFAPRGGFVFNTVHNVQAGTPLENIVAMLDAVHEYNGVTRS
jgi:hypothetical protein